MGYITDFSGAIVFKGLKDTEEKRFKDIVHNHSVGLGDEIKIEKTKDGFEIQICGGWKNYNDELEKLVRAIVKAFPHEAEGWIDACGEERDDRWALEVHGGKVKRIGFELTRAGEETLFDAKIKGGKRK